MVSGLSLTSAERGNVGGFLLGRGMLILAHQGNIFQRGPQPLDLIPGNGRVGRSIDRCDSVLCCRGVLPQCVLR